MQLKSPKRYRSFQVAFDPNNTVCTRGWRSGELLRGTCPTLNELAPVIDHVGGENRRGFGLKSSTPPA